MKTTLLLFIIAFALKSFSQSQMEGKLFDRKYFLDHPPTAKVYGEQSEMLQQEYGSEFLAANGRYVQVYNYASYYQWFFKFHADKFPNHKLYSNLFYKRKQQELYAFIKERHAKIKLLSSNLNNKLSAK